MGARAWRWLCAPRSSWPLGLLRVAVCTIILLSPEPRQALEQAARSPDLWLAPPGSSWFLPLFAWCAPHLWLLVRMLQASALLALMGLWTRASLSALALSFLVLFGGAQLSGAVVHDMHLLWFVLLLLVSPSAEVLSLDAWAAGKPWLEAASSSAAALGTLTARALLGMVYFFPGLHKLLEGGPAWAASVNLQNQLWLKWFQAGGQLPWPRIDRWPSALAAGGAAVLLFELCFLPCLAGRRGRMLALGMGLCFHASTQHFMYIPFVSLWGCYVLLWDGPQRKKDGAPEPGGSALAPSALRSALPVALLGSTLLLLVAVQGLRGDTQAWPFACYPTFAAPAPSAIADLAVEVQAPDGSRRVLRDGALPPPQGQPAPGARTPAQWSRVWALAGLYGAPVSPPQLEAFARELAQRSGAPLVNGSSARFWLETYATDPQRYGDPPLSRRRLHETRL
jgi:hypothetical protein